MNCLSVFQVPQLSEMWSHLCIGEVSKRDMTQTCKVSKTGMMQVEVHNDYGTTYPQGGCMRWAQNHSYVDVCNVAEPQIEQMGGRTRDDTWNHQE
jgi:hypothetical protein